MKIGWTRRLSSVVALSSVALAYACGGGGSPSAPSAPPPAPQERVIQQGTLSLRDGLDAIRQLGRFDTAVVPFTTTSAGLLKITVDYTFVETELLPVLFKGNCSLELAAVVKCEVASASFVRGKPYVLTMDGLASGPYTLAVTNAGLKAETMSNRITLTN